MNAAHPTAQSATPLDATLFAPAALAAHDEEDVAIGCECANPALQIEAWGTEASTQPLQRFY